MTTPPLPNKSMRLRIANLMSFLVGALAIGLVILVTYLLTSNKAHEDEISAIAQVKSDMTTCPALTRAQALRFTGFPSDTPMLKIFSTKDSLGTTCSITVNDGQIIGLQWQADPNDDIFRRSAGVDGCNPSPIPDTTISEACMQPHGEISFRSKGIAVFMTTSGISDRDRTDLMILIDRNLTGQTA